MKISCACGGVIVDSTDNLSYKGHLISDQDWEDLMDAMDRAIEQSGPSAEEKEHAAMHMRRLLSKLERTIYQCTECGALIVDKVDGGLERFVKTEPYTGSRTLGSVFGEEWKGFLIGDWSDERTGDIKGYLWGDHRFNTEFREWTELKAAYDSAFNEQEQRQRLRSATLKRNDVLIHTWQSDVIL